MEAAQNDNDRGRRRQGRDGRPDGTSRPVEATVGYELDGRAELTFAPEGLTAEIEVPLPG